MRDECQYRHGRGEVGREEETDGRDALLVVVHGQHEPAHLVDEAADDLGLGLGLCCASATLTNVSDAARGERRGPKKGEGRDDAPRDEKAWKYCAT